MPTRCQSWSQYDGRLGTLDDLRHIKEIDQFYLFFRQVQVRLEQGFQGGAAGAA
jgi:hypothetical protein